MENQTHKTKKIIIASSLLLVIVLTLSFTYAYTKKTFVGTKKQIITVAENLELRLEEGTTENIALNNAYPLKDEEGKKVDSYNFSITNPGFTDCDYSIYLVDNELESGKTRVGDQFIKYYLTNDSLQTQKSPALLSSLETDEIGKILEKNTVTRTETINYTLRFWVDYSATQEDVAGKSFSVKIKVVVGEDVIYQDESGANVPTLATGMIPVTYDKTTGKWIKADIYEEWYNYDEQWWANAVTVTDAARTNYMALDAGEPISMSDINTMWVWIPRYEYQYTNLSTSYAGGSQTSPGEIKINFISSDTTVASNSCKIPDGFTFGEENIPGFWMAKFESSGNITAECSNENCTTSNIIVKPNEVSLTNQPISSYFFATRSMQNEANANKYGFDVTGTGTMDVHMIKNTEWGIVAMLSQSRYGKYGNTNYTGTNKEVAINNCSNFITGIAGDSVNASSSASTCSTNTYETAKGNSASTTGNIYGVYDMSGGRWEYAMGIYSTEIVAYNDSSNVMFMAATEGELSGFSSSWYNQSTNKKYYDLYVFDTMASAYKPGDATYETSSWYRDASGYVDMFYPWFLRGHQYNNTQYAGIFSMAGDSGGFNNIYALRIVIKP